MCVLGANNERYEALCDVHMYVCMCLKVSVNYGQQVKVVVFFHKTGCVNTAFRILNPEEQKHCLIGSIVTTFLPAFFQTNKKIDVSVNFQKTKKCKTKM